MLLLVDTGQKRTIASPNPTSVGVAMLLEWMTDLYSYRTQFSTFQLLDGMDYGQKQIF
jgi:hypothetical protein